MSACTSQVQAHPLHVLTLTPFYPHGGDDSAGCFVSEPLKSLCACGVSNTVIAAQPFYRGMRERSGEQAIYRSFFSLPGGIGLPSSGNFLFTRTLREIRRQHQASKIDLIHAHGALPCGHAAALVGRELGIPFVVSVHGLDAFSTRQVKGFAGSWCRRNSQMGYEAARLVICVSERVREQVLAVAKNARTHVVYNGVDAQLFSPMARARSRALVLSVGNLIPSKGHELLIRAVVALASKHSDLCCEIIGDGPERARLTRIGAELGAGERVCFRGRQSRAAVAEAMQRCTMFALPSSYEGLGCVYLEAMAAGKAAIGCYGQGIEEIIESGVNGMLFHPGDLQELIVKIDRLLQDDALRDRIGRAARQTILNRYTVQHQAEQLAEAYRRCLE